MLIKLLKTDNLDDVLTLPSVDWIRISLRQLASILPAPDLMDMSLPAFISNDLVGDSSLLNKLTEIRTQWSIWSFLKVLEFCCENIRFDTYFSSLPGSALITGAWIDSRNIAPPSPSTLRAFAPIDTSFLLTENSIAPCVSTTLKWCASTSNLSWPKNRRLSKRPS